MVTTRRGKSTAATPASPSTGKAKGKVAEKKDVSNGSYAEAENHAKAARSDKKRTAGDAEPVAEVDASKRQKKAADSAAGADLQVKGASPSLQEKSALPEAKTITAAAAVDPSAGAETAVVADDLANPTSAPAEDKTEKPDVSNTSELPVSEAVKVIGGTKAGSAHVAEAPTAGKALDAVPVGPDPAAAGTAADDTPQDGDYFLEATLADSYQNNEESKPAEHITESMGTTDATKTGFQAPPDSSAPTHATTDAPAAPTHTPTDAGAASGMATDVAAAPTDVAPGVQADKGTVPHVPTGVTDGMHHPISTAPTTVNAHDSHFGAAAAQDAADLPSAVYGGDNA